MAKSIRERKSINDADKWKLTDLYPSDNAWQKAHARLVDQLETVSSDQGTFKQGAKKIQLTLSNVFALRRELARLRSYAHRKHDQDTRVNAYQGMRTTIETTASRLREAIAFVEPELLSLPTQRLESMAKDPNFADYSRYLTLLVELKPHILSAEHEALIASFSLATRTGHDAFSTFTGADLTFPDIVTGKKQRAKLSQATFSEYRSSKDRKTRENAFRTFFGTFNQFRNTLATLLGAQLQANVVKARTRNYPDALTAALFPDEVPTDVYHQMVRAANEHLPKLHQYLRFRKKRLGLKHLKYHDLYAPLIPSTKLRYPYASGVELLKKSLMPLGHVYQTALARGLSSKNAWVDIYPNTGKRSGAYMDGSAYDVHPYVLMNYLDDYNSLSTLAHEIGHAMHSHFSNDAQPYPKASYSIFVAEVASTVNEALLAEHLLATTKRKNHRQFILNQQLEGFRQTFYRQALFAEFELAAYREVEQNRPLTADSLSQIFLDLQRRYYGHDEGICEVDDRYGIEWSYVPHFYYNFYVFQYVTGITAATAIAQSILDPATGREAASRYIEHLLRAGNSAPPMEILKRVGVDLTTPRSLRGRCLCLRRETLLGRRFEVGDTIWVCVHHNT